MKDYRKVSDKRHAEDTAKVEELTKKYQDQMDKVEEAEVFIRSLAELTGKSTAEEVFQWAEEKANEDQAEKTQQDALRMLGELQVKFNLLTEQMEKIKVEGFKVVKQTNKSKGHSGTHRKEKVSQGVLECFHKNRCCAMVWADGLGQQCSRHWDKHEGGTSSRLCKTHYKHYDPETHEYTGSHGLYHINRPQKWGDMGLSVQTGTFKVGGNICWKLKQAEYDCQFKSQEFQDSIPDDLPAYCYPDAVFNDDDDDQSDSISVISGSDGTEGFPGDVANLADVEEPVEEEQVVEEQVETHTCMTCDKNKATHCVHRDAGFDEWTCDTCHRNEYPEEYEVEQEVVEEKVEEDPVAVEEEQEELVEDTTEISSGSDEEVQIECFACDKMIAKGSGHFPCEPDEEYCYECARQVEFDQQNATMANQLASSDDEQ